MFSELNDYHFFLMFKSFDMIGLLIPLDKFKPDLYVLLGFQQFICVFAMKQLCFRSCKLRRTTRNKKNSRRISNEIKHFYIITAAITI